MREGSEKIKLDKFFPSAYDSSRMQMQLIRIWENKGNC